MTTNLELAGIVTQIPTSQFCQGLLASQGELSPNTDAKLPRNPHFTRGRCQFRNNLCSFYF